MDVKDKRKNEGIMSTQKSTSEHHTFMGLNDSREKFTTKNFSSVSLAQAVANSGAANTLINVNRNDN